MRTMANYCLGATVALALVVAASAPTTAASPTVHPLVGAYYYLWNPENFAGGTLREHLVPPQQPAGSLVNSQSPRTADRDITNARQAGINFFAMDWWPYAPHSSPRIAEQANAMKAFLEAPNISRIRFAMFYETWNLGFDPGRESTPVTFAMELHFDADMASFAKDFFHNRSYLRIDGRPVVFLYLTRTLTGDVAGMIQGARTVLQRLGFNPFFIGDEVYWRVTPENPNPAGPILTTTPQVNRIEQFDAITSYILYYGDPEWLLGPTGDFTGYPGTTDIVADERHLMSRVQRGDGWPGAGHPRHRVGLQRPRFPPGDEPSGPAPPMAARRGPGLDARPSLPLCRHPGGLAHPAHGDGDVVERLERGHRD